MTNNHIPGLTTAIMYGAPGRAPYRYYLSFGLMTNDQ